MASFNPTTTAIAGGAILTAGVLAFFLRRSDGRKEPHISSLRGPKGAFLLGNAAELGKENWKDMFASWREEYGTWLLRL